MRSHQLTAISIVCAVLASMASCGRDTAVLQISTDSLQNSQSTSDANKGFGGNESDRTFNVGAIIGSSGEKPEHVFVLRNSLMRSVRVIQFINAKPCCGEVEPIEPKTLAPGDSIRLKVRIKASGSIGPISHLARVKTDLPESPELEYWTHADIIPMIRLEETTRNPVPLFPGRSALRSFVAISSGTVADPPLILDDTTVKASTGLSWEGEATESRSGSQLVESRRMFTIELKAEGLPGPRRADISIVDGKDVLLRRPVDWEVASCLKSSPTGIIAGNGSGTNNINVFIRSVDEQEFELLDASASLPGVVAEFKRGGRRGTHILHVRIEPGPANRGKTGQLTITTDHPGQRAVSIAIFVSDAS